MIYKPYKIDEIVFSLEEINEKKGGILKKDIEVKINLLTPQERQEIRKKRQIKIMEEKINKLLKEPI